MKIYHYDTETGVYLGQGLADESPLEPGVWLIPAGATTSEPPQPPKGKRVVMVNGGWRLQAIPEPEPEPEPQPVLAPVPEPPRTDLTTEERLARYGFTIDELRALLLPQEVIK